MRKGFQLGMHLLPIFSDALLSPRKTIHTLSQATGNFINSELSRPETFEIGIIKKAETTYWQTNF